MSIKSVTQALGGHPRPPRPARQSAPPTDHLAALEHHRERAAAVARAHVDDTPTEPWTPLQRATTLTNRAGDEVPMADGVEHYFNDLYNVMVRRQEHVTILSYNRKDRRALKDWRHEQAMKNQLVGPEFWGMEFYPPEDKLVDQTNQFWIWVITDPAFSPGLGFHERAVCSPERAADMGCSQRPFDPALTPAELR